MSDQKDKPVSNMVVKCNKAYLNSKVWRAGNSDNSPFACYVSWTVPAKNKTSQHQRDYNSVKLVFFPEDKENHPLIKSAQKGDIIRFDEGRLQLSSRKAKVNNEDVEVLSYAEIVVYGKGISVEHIEEKQDSQASAAASEKKSEAIPDSSGEEPPL